MPGPKKGNLTRTKEYYVELANKIHNNFYNYDKFVYSGSHNKSIIICPEHGEFEQSMNCHTRKGKTWGCPECGRKKWSKQVYKTQEKFIEEVKSIHSNKYLFDKAVYKGYKSKVIVICPKHGEWKTTPQLLLYGHGCPICNESKGEKLISNILDDYGVSYIRQYKFDDCRGLCRPLPFDFFIPLLNVAIEFDGIQHFSPVSVWGGEEGYNKLREHDSVKTEYCKNNNIKLIRIPYTLSNADIIKIISTAVAPVCHTENSLLTLNPRSLSYEHEQRPHHHPHDAFLPPGCA